MLFRKNIEKRCTYCRYSGKAGEEALLCVKCGLVSPGGQCRKFRYDPLKRVPPRPKAPDFAAMENRDFSL